VQRAAWLIGIVGVGVLISAAAVQAQSAGELAGENVYDILLPQAQPNIKGNDTGGLMVWSPRNERMAQEWADAFCRGHSKYARITSVHRQYGDYIGFNCVWSPSIARFALPAVR
jgi:hypothetical protein